MLVNHLDDSSVACSELHRSNCGSAFEAGKTGRIHLARISGTMQTKKTSYLALCGKIAWTIVKKAPSIQEGAGVVTLLGFSFMR